MDFFLSLFFRGKEISIVFNKVKQQKCYSLQSEMVISKMIMCRIDWCCGIAGRVILTKTCQRTLGFFITFNHESIKNI